MAKLVDQLESAITVGDWTQVCNVFEKMTGRVVAPPKPKETPYVFNWKTAKKAELYKELSKVMTGIGPAKNYSTEDLRDMAQIHFTDNEQDVEIEQYESLTSGFPVSTTENPNTEYTYIPPNKTPLNGDKKKLNPRFTEFPSYDDEGKAKVSRDRDAPKLISTPCRKCHEVSKVHPSLVNKGINGEKIYICPKCS